MDRGERWQGLECGEDLQIGSQKEKERDMTDLSLCLKISNSQGAAEYRRVDGLIVGNFNFKLPNKRRRECKAQVHSHHHPQHLDLELHP